MPIRAPACVLLMLAAALPAQAQPVPPPTPIAAGTAADTFYGTAVPDPYRALENTRDPAVQAWMRAEAARTGAVLARLGGRDAMRAALARYDAGAPAQVKDVQRADAGAVYFQRRSAGDNQFKLFVRDAAGAERLLVDPAAEGGSTPRAIAYYRPSPDNRYLAYALQAGGSEAAELHLVDLRDGSRKLARPITRVDYGGLHWLDGRHVTVNRLQALPPGAPAADKYRRSAVWRIDAATGRMDARAWFGPGTPGVALRPDHSAWVQASPDGRHAIATVANGVQKEIAVWVAPLARAGSARPGWRRLVDFADEVAVVAPQGGRLYALSHRGAPRSQLLQLDLDGRGMRDATVAVPQGEQVLVGMATPADALYIGVRDGNAKRLLRRAYDAPAGMPFTEVALPVRGNFWLQGFETPDTSYEPRLPGLVLAAGGWTRATQILAVQADGRVEDTGLQPPGVYDRPDDLVATEVEVPSHDGARVPMSVIHRRGLVLDGRNPTLLSGYASYGTTQEPAFNPGWLAWFDHGGVIAVANPRGSGVRGQDWYTAGRQSGKPNTWRDFIACAEWLVARGYTSPQKLGIQGGSAGGILVGRAMTERPNLFAAVVPMVGALDMVRFEDTANGPGNVAEFGSTRTEAGFRALLAMSTYHQIVPGTAYPAVLLLHGVNDPRVEVWNSSKTAARLQAASTSGKPVLLRLDWQAGHGMGNTRQQRLDERADVYAFLLWQFGVPDFQPAP